MVAPQLLINTKTLKLEKQPENKKEDEKENFETKLEQEAETKGKEDGIDSSDPVKDASNGNNENRKARLRPFLTYVVSPILVFKGLTIALVGVSFNKNGDVLKTDFLFPGLSVDVERKICVPLFLCAWSLQNLHWLLLHCSQSWENSSPPPSWPDGIAANNKS